MKTVSYCFSMGVMFKIWMAKVVNHSDYTI
jgi:hypothetical protein